MNEKEGRRVLIDTNVLISAAFTMDGIKLIVALMAWVSLVSANEWLRHCSLRELELPAPAPVLTPMLS